MPTAAFFGPGARGEATICALLYAEGLRQGGHDVDFVRIRGDADPALKPDTDALPGLTVRDVLAPEPADASALAREAIERSNPGSRLILDLPVGLLSNAPLRALIGTSVITVGPYPLHESAALLAQSRARDTDLPELDEPWLMGCDRPGGAMAASALRAELDYAAAADGIGPVRVAPFVVPRLSPCALYWLARLVPDHRTQRLALSFAAAVEKLRACTGSPYDRTTATFSIEDEPSDPTDLLRSLADDLDALKDGLGPSAEIMCSAPIIEGWRYEDRPRRVVTGTVGVGHPTVQAGHRIVSSEVFATDGRSWVRTLSRWYRLGDKRAA